jgi:hypothetical protein
MFNRDLSKGSAELLVLTFLEPFSDGVPVERPERGEGLENHKVERALKDVGLISIWHSNTEWHYFICMSNGVVQRAGRERG